MTFLYRAEVLAIAPRHELSPTLVMAVALQESWSPLWKTAMPAAYRYEPLFWSRYMAGKPEWDGANPFRVSASYGLMQVMFPTAVRHGYARTDAPEGLMVPTVGLEYGCRELAACLAWSRGDVDAGLAAYNGGRTANNAPGVTPKRNQKYVDAVRAWLRLIDAGSVRFTQEG